MLNNDPDVQGSDTTGDDSSNVAGNISKDSTIDKRKVFVFILIVLFMISVLFFFLWGWGLYKLLSIASWLLSIPQLKKQPIKYVRFAGGKTACLFKPL